MSDFYDTLAAELNREPCRCVTTDRGTDTSECTHHGTAWTCASCGDSRAWGASSAEPAVCVDCSH